jgi:Subtilase family/TIR domain
MADKSIKAIRADEAGRMFGATGKGIIWAVLDTGIHRDHVHFKQHKNLILPSSLSHADFSSVDFRSANFSSVELTENSSEEALVDSHGHGTHVAGIICGEGSYEGAHQTGVAPMCTLLSLKVIDEGRKGDEEYSVLAALDWIRSANQAAGQPIIHGATIGLSFPQSVQNFACGRSPLCEAVNNLVESGLIVVAAAGNYGYREEDGRGQGAIWGGITDPGNAELAITVGATRSVLPRDYGPSFFSSRGPTLDGRLKPDLLAPGERVWSCSIEPEPVVRKRGKSTPKRKFELRSYRPDSGTSMAAAHVSGAIALLLSVRPELIGHPRQVKQLLLETATDLKRISWAQGHGLIDVEKLITAAQEPIELEPSIPPTKPTERQPILETSEQHAVLFEEGVPAVVARDGKTFVIALSFPGTHRKLVEGVGIRLRRQMPGLRKSNIFLDSYHEHALARADLDTFLQNIYAADSELLVIFLGGDYEKSEWCNLEWRVVRDLIKKRKAKDVMLLRLDEAKVPGVLSIDGYIDVRNWEDDMIAAAIIERLAFNRKEMEPPQRGSSSSRARR